jgi:hypothetical protein
MREYILHNTLDIQWLSFAPTWTLPTRDKTFDYQRIKQVWNDYCHDQIQAKGLALLWRIEIQKRGAPHWHGLLGCPRGSRFETKIPERKLDEDQFYASVLRDEMSNQWLAACSKMGFESMAKYEYADERAFDLRAVNWDSSRWIMYLMCRKASKSRSPKTSEDIGALSVVNIGRKDLTNQEISAGKNSTMYGDASRSGQDLV